MANQSSRTMVGSSISLDYLTQTNPTNTRSKDWYEDPTLHVPGFTLHTYDSTPISVQASVVNNFYVFSKEPRLGYGKLNPLFVRPRYLVVYPLWFNLCSSRIHNVVECHCIANRTGSIVVTLRR